MKTRFSSLVKLKKNQMKKSEQFVIQSNVNLNSASVALENSYKELASLSEPKGGSIKQMLSSRMLLESQREIIQNNQEWVAFAKNQLDSAKNQLKKDTLEYEKFQYLELQEIKQELQKQKLRELKELDEIAIMGYKGKVI